MADHLLYNHDDIKRYLQKQMSKEEMHAFEKAMMEDPFLSDAFDGYQSIDHKLAANHLLEIERSIKGKKEETKVVPLISKRSNNWWRIAALFILIVGSGVLVYKLLNTSANDGTMAAKKAAHSSPIVADTIKAPVEPQKPLADLLPSKKPQSAETPAGSPIIANEPIASIASVETQKSNNKEQLETLEKKYTSDSVAFSVATASAPANRANIDQRDMAMTMGKREMVQMQSQRNSQAKQMLLPQEFKGKVVDDKGQPLAGATVTIRGTSIGTSSDINGNFKIQAPDSVVNVVASTVGRTAEEATLKSSDPNTKIALRENNASLSEVVVSKPSRELQGRAAGIRSRGLNTVPEPQIGWERFKAYIDSSSRVASKNPAFAGDVELEFKVDVDGKPYAFRNLNSAEKLLKDKAIEIIKKGPKWTKPAKDAKATVTVNF